MDLSSFEVVAHRGAPIGVPENTLPAFEKAIALGADAIEMDVRLTRDRVPIIFHYFYLNEATGLAGTVFDYTFDELRQLDPHAHIPTLVEVLEVIGGRIDLEIEIKGPEPEAPEIIGTVVQHYPEIWSTVEFTSYEPQHLVVIQGVLPDIPADLLLPKPEDWMGLDVVAYIAVQRARLAQARAVHLHPRQLTPGIVEKVHSAGIEIHAWDVNDSFALDVVRKLQIPKVCTDRLEWALEQRKTLNQD